MEATLQSAGSFLIDKGGFLGIACLVLGFAVYRLFGLLTKSWEDRLADKGAAINALNDNANALERLTDLIKAGGSR